MKHFCEVVMEGSTQKTSANSEMRNRVKTVLAYLHQNLCGKEEAVSISLLSAIASENILLLGQPGRDKSLIGRCTASAFKNFYKDGKFSIGNNDYFEYFMNGTENGTEFSDSRILFLDNIWAGSPDVLNPLLRCMEKDRVFSRMNYEKTPLCVIAGSSEADPYIAAENRKFEALRESFALHIAVKPIANDNEFFKFTESPIFAPDPNEEQKAALFSIEEIKSWQPVIDRVTLSEEAKSVISEIRRKCFDYYVSDSRWQRIIHVLKACALLNGRSKVDLIDCLLIDYAIPNRFVEEILKQHAADCKLDSRQHAQYKANIFTRQKYYEILKASIDDTKLKLEHKTENLY